MTPRTCSLVGSSAALERLDCTKRVRATRVWPAPSFRANNAPRHVRPCGPEAEQIMPKIMANKTPAPPIPRLGKHHYARELRRLQIELVRLHRHVIARGHKVLVILEGRDAAGKDGTIKR